MELADILSEESVIVCTGLKTKREVLERLAEQAAKATGQDARAVFEAVYDREVLGSTGLGNGIAIPHGKFAGIPGVTAVFARLSDPVDFDSVDDQPVDLLMLLLAPMGAGADHLKALARVARILRTESVVDALRRAPDAGKIYEILTQPLASTQAA
jgi:PTS system nitrogen regulatory IIA component